MDRRSWSLAIVGLAMVCLSGGCTQSTVAPQEPASEDETNSTQAPECQRDADCESYYRCQDGTCAVPPAMTGEVRQTTPVAHLEDQGQRVASFYLELAETLEEQRRGLMHRPSMRDDWGMLFIYESEQELSFWMKNTLISLDMIFVDASGTVVGVVHEADPETTTPRGVGVPSQYVLEINGGLAAEHGIESGATMSLEHVEGDHQMAR